MCRTYHRPYTYPNRIGNVHILCWTSHRTASPVPARSWGRRAATREKGEGMSEKASKGRKPVRPGTPVPPAGAATSPAADEEKPVEEQGAVASDGAATGGAFGEAAPDFNDYGGKPKKRHRVLKVAAIVLVVWLAFTGVRFFIEFGPFRQQAAQLSMGDAYSDNLSPDKYDLQTPQRDLEPDHEFDFELDDGVDLGLENIGDEATGDYQIADATGSARVFADGALTEEIPIQVTQVNDDGKNELQVEPTFVTCRDKSKDLDDVDGDDVFHKDTLKGAWGRWYGFGGYYLVRYIGSDGKKLEKPQVTYFTVQDDVNAPENQFAAPQNLQFAVQDDGGLGISWDKVDGAKKYKVYMKTVDPTVSDPSQGVELSLLATTTDTKINTLDYDPESKDSQQRAADDAAKWGDAGASNYHQNYQFDDLVIGDDEDAVYYNREKAKQGAQGLEVAYAPTKDKVKATSITVVAVGDGSDDQQSPFQFKSINNLLSQIPVKDAINVNSDWAQQAPDSRADPKAYLAHRLITYVTMADGTAASIVNDIDVSKMTSTDSSMIEGADESDPSTWSKRSYTRLEIPYKVRNTLITSTFTLDGTDWPGGADEIEKAADEQLTAMAKANPAVGSPQRANFDNDVDWAAIQKSAKAVSEPADVPYPVSGSSDYVKFVASNIMAGNMYLDITKYATQAGAPDITDVVEEACAQNPMTMVWPGGMSVNERTEGDKVTVALYINGLNAEGEDNDIPALNKKREETYKVIKQIVADAVQDGMSDADKVKALDAALSNRLFYDWDSYYLNSGQGDKADVDPMDVWKHRGYAAYELLDDNRVVCSGYAAIFKACADEAGVKSLYVTGTVPPRPGSNNNGHAWNLVNVDGTWKVVDVTWDDTDRGDNQSDGQYLMLDQKDPKLDGRVYDKDALLDSVVEDYVDPSRLAA